MKLYESDTPDPDGPIRVGVADYVVTSADTRLTTTGLGSCVGVALVDTEAGLAGLAHVMLPSADGSDEEAKFADTAIEAMLEELYDMEATHVEAKIAGGSNMLDLSGVGKEVGSRNVAATRDALDEHDVPLVGADTGGSHGRSLELHTDSGTLVVRSAHEEVTRL